MDIRPLTFSYAELRAATNDFSSANKLGEGGFGGTGDQLKGVGREEERLGGEEEHCTSVEGILELWFMAKKKRKEDQTRQRRHRQR